MTEFSHLFFGLLSQLVLPVCFICFLSPCLTCCAGLCNALFPWYKLWIKGNFRVNKTKRTLFSINLIQTLQRNGNGNKKTLLEGLLSMNLNVGSQHTLGSGNLMAHILTTHMFSINKFLPLICNSTPNLANSTFKPPPPTFWPPPDGEEWNGLGALLHQQSAFNGKGLCM